MIDLSRVLAAILAALIFHSVAAGKSPQEAPSAKGYVRLQFGEHLRIPQGFELVGTTGVRSISFRLPSTVRPLPGSSLHLFVQHSDNLDAERSFLSVSLNHGILRSFRLGHQKSGPTELVVPIPPDMLKVENQLEFFIEQYPQAGAAGGRISSRIGARSYLAIRFTQAPPELNLAMLPAPLLEPHELRNNALSVLLPASFVPSTFEATALLVANLCKPLAPERVSVGVVRSMHAARQPLLVVGTPAEQPHLVSRVRGKTVLRLSNGEVLDGDEGLVGLATRNQTDPHPILFVTGNSSSAVLRAARSVVSPEWNASGNFVRVVKDVSVAAAKLREWPRFIPPRSLFKLAEVGLEELKITAQNSNSLTIALNAPPDARFLDYGNRMVLKFRLAPDSYLRDARLLVQLNGVTLIDEAVRDKFRGLIASVPITVPGSVLKPRNVLRIVWTGLSHPVNHGVVAWLLPSSEFYLPRYYETELPELGLLQFQLYPFSLKGDLSDVIVVLPNKLNEETFSALMELSARFAQLAPGPHLAFRVRRLADLSEADLADSHLVFLTLEAHPDPLVPLLGRWRAGLGTKPRYGQPTIREMASPWNAQKYVLIISAQSGRLQRAVSEWFSESNLAQVRGDIAYLGANRPESFVVGPRLKITEYSYSLLIEAWLRTHWLALPIILIAVSGLLFVGVRLALRHYGKSIR